MFEAIRELLGGGKLNIIGDAVKRAAQGAAQQQQQAQPIRQTEDSGLVNNPHQIQPQSQALQQVKQYAQQWQNPDNGYSPNGYSQAQTQWQNRIPVGQKLTSQDISRLPQEQQGNARIYNLNPYDPRVSHMDPNLFGYQPDDTAQPPSGLVNGYRPMAGYYQQAVQYANAFKPTPGHPYGTSDTNPAVVGPNSIDPKYFGYPEDIGQYK